MIESDCFWLVIGNIAIKAGLHEDIYWQPYQLFQIAPVGQLFHYCFPNSLNTVRWTDLHCPKLTEYRMILRSQLMLREAVMPLLM